MMNSDNILSDYFRVSVGRKSRDYHAVLCDNSLLLKPLDFMSGKFVELFGSRIVTCREIPDTDTGTLFTVTYLPSDSALDMKVFTFSRRFSAVQYDCGNGIEVSEDINVSVERLYIFASRCMRL